MRYSLKVLSAAVLLFALSTPAFALYKFNPFTGKQDYYETGASGAITVDTIDTGQGANEVYDMDQNVLTTSTPTFSTLTVADEAYDATNWDADLTVPTKNAVRDKIESLSIVSPFTTAANLTYLTTTTDNLAVGGSTNLGKVTIDGDTDERQLVVQGNATQTNEILLVEKSDGTDLFKVANDGTVTSSGSGTEALTLGSGSQATYVLTANVSGTDTTYTFGSGVMTASSNIAVADDAYDATGWNGSSNVPTKNAVRDKIESLSAGGGPSYWELNLMPQGAVLDDTSFPAISVEESTGTGTPRFYSMAFDPTTDEIVYYQFTVPTDMAAGDWLLVVSWMTNDTGANEDAIWAARIAAITEGDTDTPLEHAAATTNTASENCNATEANRLIQTTITITNTDSVAAGDLVQLVFFRDANDSVGDADNDGLTSDARVLNLRLKIPRA